MNFKFLLRNNAPGKRPASVNTWNPLQIPRTGFPASAAFTTSDITLDWLAIAPQRK